MRTFDLAPLYRSTVGFDRLFSLFDQLGDGGSPGYPPYNIERTGENDYRVTVAVAGFAEPELNIEVKENTLTIRGDKQTKTESKRARRSIRASRRAPSSACSSSPTTSRSRARRWRTVCCTSTSCAKSPRPRSRARLRSAAATARWSKPRRPDTAAEEPTSADHPFDRRERPGFRGAFILRSAALPGSSRSDQIAETAFLLVLLVDRRGSGNRRRRRSHSIGGASRCSRRRHLRFRGRNGRRCDGFSGGEFGPRPRQRQRTATLGGGVRAVVGAAGRSRQGVVSGDRLIGRRIIKISRQACRPRIRAVAVRHRSDARPADARRAAATAALPVPATLRVGANGITRTMCPMRASTTTRTSRPAGLTACST